jgi:hypothetical protein
MLKIDIIRAGRKKKGKTGRKFREGLSGLKRRPAADVPVLAMRALVPDQVARSAAHEHVVPHQTGQVPPGGHVVGVAEPPRADASQFRQLHPGTSHFRVLQSNVALATIRANAGRPGKKCSLNGEFFGVVISCPP